LLDVAKLAQKCCHLIKAHKGSPASEAEVEGVLWNTDHHS
jgi:hypothetical protein